MSSPAPSSLSKLEFSSNNFILRGSSYLARMLRGAAPCAAGVCRGRPGGSGCERGGRGPSPPCIRSTLLTVSTLDNTKYPIKDCNAAPSSLFLPRVFGTFYKERSLITQGYLVTPKRF